MNMVDDVTGITQAYLGKEETTWAAVHVLRLWIAQHGVPLALYTDWKNVYKVAPTPQQELRGEEPLTQFGRMCADLGIRILGAYSPQAKGRAERKNGVHQDRLVKKLRRQGIASYDAANGYLQEHYLPDLNWRFSQSPAGPENYHRPSPRAEELNAIFRLRTEHWVSNDWVVRHQGRFLQLLPLRRCYGPRQAQAVVYESVDGQLEVRYRNQPIASTEISTPPRNQETASPATVHVPFPRGRHRPGLDHPYKRYAEKEMKQRRRRLLAQAVSARAVGAASAASNGSAPAPPTVTLSPVKEGDILIAAKRGTF
jgi:hypothetical protein